MRVLFSQQAVERDGLFFSRKVHSTIALPSFWVEVVNRKLF
ncbi:hypothetical protein J2Y03_001898 [Neobacillus niacini]|nr:hypothetical protein [Neobacillus niacini]MDR7076875.1 hypothetical protein [Neobacillus niacini]